jgi:hypothetical protein
MIILKDIIMNTIPTGVGAIEPRTEATEPQRSKEAKGIGYIKPTLNLKFPSN